MSPNLVLGSRLAALLGVDRIVTDRSIISSRSHDYWLLDMQRRLHGVAPDQPLLVVQPHNEDDVSKLLSFAHAEGLHIVPFGAGSGVCGGARPDKNDVVLDLSLMNRIIAINETALTVTVQPGMLGNDFEAALNARGYSMGHFPQSIYLSSVGGWVATRASGQYSTKYGSIEDMLVALNVVLADGTSVRSHNSPRSSTGPSLNELMLGSEGTLAVITEITYRIHPLPQKEAGRAFSFVNFHMGLQAIRKITRAGWQPALVRLYDESETTRHFGSAHKNSCVLLLLSEGPEALVDVELSECSRIAEHNGGKPLGATLVDQWKHNRFKVPDVNELAVSKGVVFDTIEISANWDRIDDLYDAVIRSLKSVPGIIAASAHSSHSYQQGSCLYFTFAAKKPHWLPRIIAGKLSFGHYSGFTSPADVSFVEQLYTDCWSRVMQATVDNGGSISHHHGIGKVRAGWLATELGASGVDVLRAVKHALDPNGVLNRSTLIPAEDS
ncbi:FAD-binding oxidoreductase [soil metagenome]